MLKKTTPAVESGWTGGGEDGSDHGFKSSGLGEEGGADGVVVFCEVEATFGHGVAFEGEALDDDAGGLASGVGVDHSEGAEGLDVFAIH